MASLESGRWVGEERYEMVNFSPAVRNIRLEKEATSGAFRSELFRGDKSFNVYNNDVKRHRSWSKLCLLSINKSNVVLHSFLRC